MSKEFEEIVLRKLDNLEAGLKDNNQRLGSLETEVKDTKQGLQQLSKETNQRLEKLEVEAKDTNQRLGKLEVEAKDTNQRLGKLEIEVKDTGEVVKYLNNNFTKFDFEINKKIDTLFDAITTNNQKHEFYEGNIASLNAKTFNHDIRISNIEDKVLTA